MVVLLLSCTKQESNAKGEEVRTTKQDQNNSMNIELLFFEKWGEQLPLAIQEIDNSGGFLQIGEVTIQKERPALNMVAGQGQWQLQSRETILWRGGQLPQLNGSAAYEKGPFDEVLFHGDDQVVLISSGNHIQILEGGTVTKEIQERGAGRTQAGKAYLATYENGKIQVQFSDGETKILTVGAEGDQDGPWVVRSADGPKWLVANHKQLRFYQADGTLIKEEALNNKNYSEVLFPMAWEVKQTVAESPSSYLVAISGPEGFGVLRYAE